MSVERNGNTARDAADGAFVGFAIQQHQIQSAADPAMPVQFLIASASRPRRFVGDPWLVCKDNPELARMVNDRLAASSN
jgi:hypothetical protein